MTEDKNKKALFDAIKNKNLDSIKNLIENDVEFYINMQNNDGDTPLHLAIKNDDTKIIDYLLSKKEKIDFSIQNNFGKNILHLASKSNNMNVVKYIIENEKIDINMQDNDGDTPLYLAIKNDNIEIVDYLLDTKKIDLKNDKNKEILGKLLYFDISNLNNDEIVENIKQNNRFIKAIKDCDVELFKNIVDDKNFKFKDREKEKEILFFINDIMEERKTTENNNFIQMIHILFENKNIELDLTQKRNEFTIRRISFSGKKYNYKREYITTISELICCCLKFNSREFRDLLEYLIKNYPESKNNIDEDLIIVNNMSDYENNLFHNICEMYKNKISDRILNNISTTRILKTLFNKIKNKEKYINAKNKDDNTPLDLAISSDNREAIGFLIKQKETNFKIIKKRNRETLLYNFILNKENDLFKKYFNKDYLNNSFTMNNIIEKFLNQALVTMNKDLVRTIVNYTLENINNSINCKGDYSLDINKKLLKVLITAENPYLDIINDTLNKIDKKYLEQIRNENLKDFQIEEYNNGNEVKYFIKGIKDVRKYFEEYSGKEIKEFQGKNQVLVNRTFNYDNDSGKLLSITDKAFKIGNNDIVYKKVKNSKIEEENITYYKEGTKEENEGNELIKAVIDENRYIKFDNCKIQDLEKEVNNILNSYENPDGFDDILSYLEYSQIKLNENNRDFSVKVNHKNDFCNGIVNTFYESIENKEKIYFYNFSSNGHNVQLIICNGKIVLFNTGEEFDYQCTNIQGKIELDDRYDKLSEDMKNSLNVTEFKAVEQTIGNCNLSSKIFVVNFANNNIYEDFSKLLNDIGQLKNCEKDKEIIKLSNNILELSCQIFNENKNNYLVMSNKFAEVVKKIEKSIVKKYEKIKNNKQNSQGEIKKYESLIKKISLLEIKIIKEVQNEMEYLKNVYNILNEKTQDLEKLKEEKKCIEEAIFNLDNKKMTKEVVIENLKDKGIELEEKKEETENSFKDRLKELKLNKEEIITKKIDYIEKNKELKNRIPKIKTSLQEIINFFYKKNKEKSL